MPMTQMIAVTVKMPLRDYASFEDLANETGVHIMRTEFADPEMIETVSVKPVRKKRKTSTYLSKADVLLLVNLRARNPGDTYRQILIASGMSCGVESARRAIIGEMDERLGITAAERAEAMKVKPVQKRSVDNYRDLGIN